MDAYPFNGQSSLFTTHCCYFASFLPMAHRCSFSYCIRVVGISNTEVKNLCALYLSHLTKRGGFVKIDYFLKAATSDFISYNGNRAIFIY